MNYLAHAYLSFNDPDTLAGNMISDFVKGRKKFDFPVSIQKGIVLHRAIDDFTDTHPATKAAMEYFREDYRLYSGAFIDVSYDHFLANDTINFPDETALNAFAAESYTSLENNIDLLPARFQQLFPYMKTQNWLYNYRFKTGIERSFEGLVRRAVYMNDWQKAIELFNLHYDALNACYQSFFPQLKNFAFDKWVELNTN